MASDHASGSRSIRSRPNSVTSDILLDPTAPVVMTNEIHPSAKPRRMLNQYEFLHKVGRGQHGEVYLARDSKKDMRVAIKAVKRKNHRVDRMSQLRKRNLPSTPHLPLTDALGSTEHKIRKEIAIMKKCRHPHVVRLLEVIDDALNEKIYMVMEYLGGGEIKWRTANDDPVLRVEQTRRICRDVILGLEYLHHQGIIHRDIKPANLLWSEDRRTVKITDFGVSHFSYAQRLAAAGNNAISPDDTDPILMDDSDLSKTAGTPTFLAPEIVNDYAVEPSASSSTLHLSLPRKKPPITKAIDVWALGVTLYCLLFGRLPFQAGTEYEIYQVIRYQDWDVHETMGVDRIPTGPKIPKLQPRDVPTEGNLAVDLLTRLLEKKVSKRITLDQMKRHPWILRDIADPERWLRETQLDRHSLDEPTPDETSSAMSSVYFRWSSRLTTGLSSILRNVRSKRSFRNNQAQRDKEDELANRVGTRSAPNETLPPTTLSRHRSSHIRTIDPREHPRDKSKNRLSHRSELLPNKSTTDVSSRQKTFEPWAMWDSGRPGPSSSSSASRSRQGSGSSRSKTPEMTLQVPARPPRVGSPLPSPLSVSQTSSPFSTEPTSPEDRPRSRLSLSSWMRNYWTKGEKKQVITQSEPDQKTDPRSSVSVNTASVAMARERLTRRSEDPLGAGKGLEQQGTSSGPLMFGMRASSYGDVHARPSEDLTSLYSAERVDDLDEDTFLIGAGGVAHSPILSIPASGLMSTISSAASLGPPMSAVHAILQRGEAGGSGNEGAPSVDTDSGAHSRQSMSKVRTTSPLSQMYNRGELCRVSVDMDAASDEYDDDSSIFDQASRSGQVDDEQPSTAQRYQDEDEESDDEDQLRLEVRTRRPSASATDMSPVRRKSENGHRERSMICI